VGVHFFVFAVLGVLVSASRLPLGRARLAALLVGYATATELLQWPVGRDTSSLDLLGNLLGLAAGTAIWWGVQKRVLRMPRGRG
jgi:VanZ family protein